MDTPQHILIQLDTHGLCSLLQPLLVVFIFRNSMLHFIDLPSQFDPYFELVQEISFHWQFRNLILP